MHATHSVDPVAVATAKTLPLLSHPVVLRDYTRVSCVRIAFDEIHSLEVGNRNGTPRAVCSRMISPSVWDKTYAYLTQADANEAIAMDNAARLAMDAMFSRA